MKKIAFFVFSGTNNTWYVAGLLKNELEATGNSCDIFTVNDRFIQSGVPQLSGYDMVGIAHPIHAFETPVIMYDLVRALPASSGMPLFILKTCGEAASGLNGAASWSLITLLQRKGYLPFYERSFAMGSNWLVRYEDGLTRELARVAKDKARHMCGELLAGTKRLCRTSAPFRALVKTVYSGYRIFFLRWNSKDLYADRRCNGCGKCVRECPRKNIAIKSERPVFGWRCISCMRCLYLCPQDAINYRIMKPLKLKPGYDLQSILAAAEGSVEDVAWKNSRHYRSMILYIDDVAG